LVVVYLNLYSVMLHAVAPSPPRLSTWQRFKRSLGNMIMESPVLQTLCCYDASEVEAYRTDERIRSDIRESMRLHMGYGNRDTCVEQTMVEVMNETGYNLGKLDALREANANIKRSMREWDAYFARMGIDPVKPDIVGLLPACVVPRFAASMALHLRSKLGRLAPNEANMLLAEREYLRVARGLKVRDVDIVSHQQFTLNAMFGETLLDDIALTRTRLPKWMRWAFEVEGLREHTRAC